MHICNNARGKPVHFEGTKFDESWYWSHESDGKAHVGDLLLLDGLQIDFFFGGVGFFIFLVEIWDYVKDLTFSRLWDFWEKRYKLISQFFNLWTLLSHLNNDLFIVKQLFDLYFRVLVPFWLYNEIGDHFSFEGFCGVLGNVEDGSSEGMFFYSFRFKVFDE